LAGHTNPEWERRGGVTSAKCCLALVDGSAVDGDPSGGLGATTGVVELGLLCIPKPDNGGKLTGFWFVTDEVG